MGTRQNGVVAQRIERGVASVVVQTLRIQTWMPTMPFIYYDQDEVYTGTCKGF
jgi:hypothetical protein